MKLLNVDSLALSSFSKNTSLINEYKNQKIIDVISLPRGKKVQKGEYFELHINNYYNGDLNEFVEMSTRGESTAKYGDDKIKHIAPQEGLFVWSRDAITLTSETCIENEEGIISFIHDSVKIDLCDTVEVVGVENFESLVHAKALYQSFEFSKKVLFIYRNKSFLKLIQKISNPIKYIPDYDMFGIRIYETEILKYNSSVELLIPLNIELMFDTVQTHKKYLDQKHMKGGNYKAITQRGKYLISLMEKYKRIIPQEYLHSIQNS